MSIHDKLKRVRKPRVHITYDVETEGAIVKKELPFVEEKVPILMQDLLGLIFSSLLNFLTAN